MANIYVYSGAAGAGTGADWANAYTTLDAAGEAAGTAAGDDIYVAHDHAESSDGVAISTSFKGTLAAPSRVLCVNRAGTVPPVAADLRTTATITTINTAAITIIGAGMYFEGLTWSAGSGSVNSIISIGNNTTNGLSFKNCAFIKAGTTANTAAITIGASAAGVRSFIRLENCTMQFGATGDGITMNGSTLVWKNTASAIAGATLPTTLFRSMATSYVFCNGVDLSAIAGTLVAAVARSTEFANCKFHASATVAGRMSNYERFSTTVIRSDSGATNYVHSKVSDYAGDQIIEATIFRTGGATDGTKPIAWNITTTANSEIVSPFECLPIFVWNATTGAAITVTLEGIWGEALVPDNDDIWMEVEYPGSALTPLSSFATSGKATVLTTASSYAAGTGTWGGSTTQFAMSATFTPQMAGPLTVRIYAALPSKTFYIDPKPVVT